MKRTFTNCLCLIPIVFLGIALSANNRFNVTGNELDGGRGILSSSPVAQVAEPAVLPIAHGQEKWLGGVYSQSQVRDFTLYWNQVTPENAGKWGSVESTRDVMRWGELDNAYKLAKDNGFPFRFHVLVWGNQQPSWIENLPPEEQLAEIEEWFTLVAERYPDIEYLEVVNEPLHDPPRRTSATDSGAGNYYEALGGAGETGWDWILNSFRMARRIFPATTKLMINDYNIVSSTSNANRYMGIINLLKNENLIDGIGVQAHAFSTRGSAASIKSIVDLLATLGLPIQATEMDIDGPDDLVHIRDYQKIFPVFWEHPMVEGITLWGYRPGMWRTDQGAFLINRKGEERPALKWLRAYVEGTWIPVQTITMSAEGDVTQIDSIGGQIQFQAQVTPSDATVSNVYWRVNKPNVATIDENGLLTALAQGTVTVTAVAGDGSNKQAALEINSMGLIKGVNRSGLTGIGLYPNPVIDKLYLTGFDGWGTITISSVTGGAVKKIESIGPDGSIDMSDLPKGLYIVRIKSHNGEVFTGRAVKR